MAISDPQNEGDFFAQFLDDYYAECNEHLTLVRRNLLALEAEVGKPHVEQGLLDELFRSFHTLKGISGMVGLNPAEQLAHHLESYLRALRKGEAALSVEGIDTLIKGASTLEQVISARRNEQVPPSIDEIVAGVKAIVSEPGSAEPREPERAGTGNIDPEPAGTSPESSAGGAAFGSSTTLPSAKSRTWQIEFIPTPALAERGVNVNSIRAHLQEIGEVVQARPLVKGHGEIAFVFVVETNSDESAFAGLEIDEIKLVAIEGDAPAKNNVSEAEVTRNSAIENGREHATQISSHGTMLSPSNLVRVDLARLDELMRIIGDLVISRARLEDQVKLLKTSVPSAEWRTLQETGLQMSRQLRDLREGVMRVRMVQLGEIFERMQFVVRDLARESGKRITIETLGSETEIDKFLVDRMMDPLMHLVRNSVSHGLEPTAEREAEGKSAQGKLTLRAATVGESVVIEIADDGRGIDRERVTHLAQAQGIIDSTAGIDDAALLEVICTPGFSTRDNADRGSGRGVGMDVVRKTVEDLGGTISLTTVKSQGTRFTIELPLTLAIAKALIVKVDDQIFAVPQSVVREVIEVESTSLKLLENNQIILYRGGVLPLVRLAKFFGLKDASRETIHVFVIGTGGSAFGVAVDRIIGQRDIVVRGIGDPLVQVAGIAGATELGDERIVLILDVAALRNSATRGHSIKQISKFI